VSTRGDAPVLGFEEVLLAGLARDGGLYVPESWPQLSGDDWRRLRGRPYAEVAFHVMRPFVEGAVPDEVLRPMIAEAYRPFPPAVTPLRQLDANLWLLELFHGPTLAFKDVAMQLLARLMDWALERRGDTATIVAATSGDTGGAAIEAFRHIERVRLFVLHPHGRVSDVQRRQMTTVDAPNIHNIAIEGTFDDCQALVKAMFNDAPLRDRLRLAGVNSINWARIMAQIVYYATSALALGGPERRVSFTVPTGNFGDIFAGYVAKGMGLPIERLVIATNRNDILDRTLKTGRCEVRAVVPSTSPSMDIQVSSNFERLLFGLHGRDGDAVRRLMAMLAQSGAFVLGAGALARLRADFSSGMAGDDEAARVIADVYRGTGELVDPHTAVGLAVAERHARPETPMIALATAHPAKFPDAVEAAAGVRPPLPSRLADLHERKERMAILANDYASVAAFVAERAQ
jgi:threonine synthase